MARKRLVTFHDLRRLLLRRYVDKSCTAEERYTLEIMRFEDENFNVECMLMLGEEDVADGADAGGEPAASVQPVPALRHG